MLKICLLSTEYQKKIFFAILAQTKQDKNDFIFILTDSIYNIEGVNNVYRVKRKGLKLSLRDARHLIAEVKDYVLKKIGNKKYALWLATNDHPVGQILLNNHRCLSINIFEDGLGSYVKHGFFDLDRSFINIIARMKNWMYLFPTFRAARLCGSYPYINSGWACAHTAFPGLLSEVQVIAKEYLIPQFVPPNNLKFELKKTEKILFFLDQPIIENRIMSASQYRQSVLSALVELMVQIKGIDQILVKNHPRSDPNVFLETVDFLKKQLDINVEGCDIACNFETLLLFLKEKQSNENFVVASNFSTALYTTKILIPDVEAYCISDQHIVKKHSQGAFILRYINALKVFGVKLITIN